MSIFVRANTKFSFKRAKKRFLKELWIVRTDTVVSSNRRATNKERNLVDGHESVSALCFRPRFLAKREALKILSERVNIDIMFRVPSFPDISSALLSMYLFRRPSSLISDGPLPHLYSWAHRKPSS